MPVEDGEARDPVQLTAIDDAPQRLRLLARRVAQIFRHFNAALGHVAYTLLSVPDAVLGFFTPILQRVLGVVVAAFQIAAELLAGFRGKRQRRQGSRTQSNQKE